MNILSNIFKNKVFIGIIIFIIVVQIGLIYYGGSLFRTTGLTLKEFMFMLSLSFTVVPVDMFRKIYLSKSGVVKEI